MRCTMSGLDEPPTRGETSEEAPGGTLLVMVHPHGRWVVVEETVCSDGDNDAAIRAFKAAHPEYPTDSDRLQIEIMCDRASGQSTVRFSWDTDPPDRPPRRKPRHPK